MASDNNISLLILTDVKAPLCVTAFSEFYIKIIHDEYDLKDSLLQERFEAIIITQSDMNDDFCRVIRSVNLMWPWIPILITENGHKLIKGTIPLEIKNNSDEMKKIVSELIFNKRSGGVHESFFLEFTELTQRVGNILFGNEQWSKEILLAQKISKVFKKIFVGFLDMHYIEFEEVSSITKHNNFKKFLQKELATRIHFINGEFSIEEIPLSIKYDSTAPEKEYDRQRLFTVPVLEERSVSGFLVIYFTDESEFTNAEIRCLLRYISQTIYTIHQAREISGRDSLTGLYNHSYLNRALTRHRDLSVKQNTHMSLTMLDIDYFKNLNDSYGHQIGDLLIIELGKLLKSVTKKQDIVARCGGDEMIILHPNTNGNGARKFAERLLQTVRDFEFTAAGCPLHFTISIGIASTDELEIVNDSDLIELADKAMYLAKKSGRNQYCVASDVIATMNDQTTEYSEYNSRTLAKYQNSQLGKGKILVVDDDIQIVTLLTRILEYSDYEVISTTSATKALELIRSKPDLFDVILTDINMPKMDGVQLLKSIHDVDPNIVGIIITGFASTQNTINALRAGAYNLVQKPFDVDELNLIVERAVERRRLKRQLDAYHVNLEEVLQDKTKALHSALNEVKGAYIKTMETIIRILDAHETTMANHSQRVSQLSVFLAEQMGINDSETLNTIKYGALLHDIGKIGISDTILTKPSKLTEKEWEIMKEHPEIGYNIVKTIPVLERASEMVLSHHEHFDGSGYPRGIAGEKICIEARIFAVIDAYDALRNHRCYQEAQELDVIVNEINNCSGTHFDPKVVNAFNNCYQQLDELPIASNSFWENF